MTTPRRRCALGVCHGEELKFRRSRGPCSRGTKAAVFAPLQREQSSRLASPKILALKRTGGCAGMHAYQPKGSNGEKVMTATKRFLLLLGVVLCCAAAAMAQFPPTSVFQLDGEVVTNPNYPQCTYVVKGSDPV